MIHSTCGAALLLLTLAVAAPAQRPIGSGTVKEGTLSFDAKATAGDFVGKTSKVTGEFTGGADLDAVKGWVEAPTGSLRTGNDHRDRDMLNKSLEAEKFPVMRFQLTELKAEPGSSDSVAVMLKGELTLHGQTRPVEIPGTVVRHGEEARILSSFPVDVRDYKVSSLSRFLGMFKMDPHILVHVDVTFSVHPQ